VLGRELAQSAYACCVDLQALRPAQVMRVGPRALKLSRLLRSERDGGWGHQTRLVGSDWDGRLHCRIEFSYGYKAPGSRHPQAGTPPLLFFDWRDRDVRVGVPKRERTVPAGGRLRLVMNSVYAVVHEGPRHQSLCDALGQ
jgi:hypothetical protein